MIKSTPPQSATEENVTKVSYQNRRLLKQLSTIIVEFLP